MPDFFYLFGFYFEQLGGAQGTIQAGFRGPPGAQGMELGLDVCKAMPYVLYSLSSPWDLISSIREVVHLVRLLPCISWPRLISGTTLLPDQE